MIVARKRVSASLGSSEPRLVQLSAPPGYGKTELARIWARRFDRHAVCECTGVAGTIDFIGRIMSALSEESYGSGTSSALTRLALHASEANAAAWSRALLEGWKTRQERALLIFEHADAITNDPQLLAVLGDMLAARPAERAILISSQNALPLRVAHYLAPHEVLTFSRDELQLDADEASGIFEGTDLSPRIVERIVCVTRGWPIVLLLLARIAHYEANVEALLDRLGDSLPDMPEFLLNEVLAALTPDMMSSVLAVAAIPHATLEDITGATGIAHPAPLMESLLRLPAFISYESGTYSVHPLLHSLLRARYEREFAEYLGRAATENQRLGDFLRASELFAVQGNMQAAAATLDQMPIASFAHPSARLIETLAQIPVRILCDRPNLWMATLRFRRLSIDAGRLYQESVALQERARADAPPALARRLGVRRAMLAHELDRLEEAQSALETAAPRHALEENAEEHRLILMTAAVVAAKRGRLSEAERLVEEADAVQGARHLRFDEERSQIALEKARIHGDWDDFLRMSEERLTLAQRTGVAARIVEAAQDAAWAAWCANDDDRTAAATAVARECGDGAAIDSTPARIAMGHLQKALASGEREGALALLERAIAAADAGENDSLRIFVRVGAALLAQEERHRLFEARVIATRIESPPLQASIELLVDAREPVDYGIFKNLGKRVSRSPLRAGHAGLYIDVAHGQARRGADVLHVSDRGLELLSALALLPPVTSEELAAAIWPNLDAKAALNSLKMCVSRTRAQIGDREAIQSLRNGYALGSHVGSDLRELEKLVQSIRGGTVGESTRRQIRYTLLAWGRPRLAHAAHWAWFSQYEPRLDKLRRELSQAIADEHSEQSAEPAPV